jgi:hypothetical protein
MSFNLFVQLPSEKTIALRVKKGISLNEVKNLCWDRTGVHPDDFNLLRGSKIIGADDSFTRPDDNIRVHVKIKGGRAIVFTEANFDGTVTKKKLGTYDPDRPWLTCSPGLGIQARCNNWKHMDGKPCPIVEKSNGTFIVSKGMGAFQISDDVQCPQCKARGEIITFIFSGACEYSINGTYQDSENTTKTITRTGEVTDSNDYVIFEPEDDGASKKKVEWSCLRVQTCKPTGGTKSK